MDLKGKGAQLTTDAVGSITSRAATAHSRGVTGGISRAPSAKSLDMGDSVSLSQKHPGGAVSSSVSTANSARGGDSTPGQHVDSQTAEPQDLAHSLARILNQQEDTVLNEAAHRKGSGDLGDIVSDVHKSIKQKKNDQMKKNVWTNPFSKEKLIKIWKHTNPTLLANDEERYAYRLMQKYNGSYGAYMELALDFQRRKKNDSKMGAHIKWDVHGMTADPDVDNRAREVQIELDRAIANPNFWMDSLVLHTNDQRFPTAVLRLQLEEELDNILADQV